MRKMHDSYGTVIEINNLNFVLTDKVVEQTTGLELKSYTHTHEYGGGGYQFHKYNNLLEFIDDIIKHTRKEAIRETKEKIRSAIFD